MLEHLHRLPPDPLLGLMAKFSVDENPNKIDLGVGIYKNEQSSTPVLASVKQAEAFLLANETSKAYVGPAGNVEFSSAMSGLIFGDALARINSRLFTLQTPGGCGALRVLAETIIKASPDTTLWVGNPTWANHVPLLGSAGLKICEYPYYDYSNHAVSFDAMLSALEQAKAGDTVLLHGCCHNPSGADLNSDQWRQLIQFCKERGLVPLIDIAYQGFGDSLLGDTFGIRLAVQELDEVFVAVSCSKNFGLYRERVGAALVIAKSPDVAAACGSHMFAITRGIYSMPPSHGASIVATILNSVELRQQWTQELEEMRLRISGLRGQLAGQLNASQSVRDFSFIQREKGMFSFLGIDPSQVDQAAEQYGIYMAGSSRVNLAGLNSNNMDYFCESLLKILR